MNRNPEGLPSRAPSSALVAGCAAILALIIVGAISFTSLVVLLEHGLVALCIIAGATGLGLCLVDALNLGTMETRWRWTSAAALGLGALSLLVLGLGVMGFLRRALWIAILIIFAIGGAARPFGRRSPHEIRNAANSLRWLWLAAAAFAGLTLLAATLPPGILWPAEGNGYDVLEYHLGAPREYFEAGRIGYLPHNIYSNFPFNVEMLYLLAMVLQGGAIQAALTAQLLHAFLGMLAAAAVWLAGREISRGAGIVAGIMAATCPFMTYLGALAYDEWGLLFFSAVALAAIIRSAQASSTRWTVIAGLCAGFACGCKYTGVTATLVPLAIAALWLAMRQRKPSRAIAFIGAALISVSPWLIKNVRYTGNPVFPLARSVFHERAGVWDDDGAARWHEGHLPAPEDRPLPARIRRTWRQIFGSAMFGPIFGLAIAAEVVRRFLRRRSSSNFDACVMGCYSMFFIGLAIWFCFTHLVDRFAIVLLIPACVMLGHSYEALRPILRGWIFPVILLATAGLNLRTVLGTFSDAHAFEILAVRDSDRTDWFTGGHWAHAEHIPKLNELTASGKKILMVGDAQRFYLNAGVDDCVVFNRNPFAEAAARRSPAELIDWLRQQGYTHVYVDWGEMNRLRRSRYGFWKSIDVELFKRLQAEGLQPILNFSMEEGKPPYATLFIVPAPR